MDLSTIEMSRTDAEAAFAEWAAEVKQARSTEEDAAIAAGYRAIAAGKRLLTLSDTLRAGGCDDLHRPRLAVAPATARTVYLTRQTSGTVGYTVSDDTRAMARWDWDQPVTATRVIARDVLDPIRGIAWSDERELRGFGWKAMVPVVPPRFRTRGWRSSYILFEAEWAKHSPPAPIDPALIQHLRGDLWIVRGVWDLTPLERAVLLERNRR